MGIPYQHPKYQLVGASSVKPSEEGDMDIHLLQCVADVFMDPVYFINFCHRSHSDAQRIMSPVFRAARIPLLIGCFT